MKPTPDFLAKLDSAVFSIPAALSQEDRKSLLRVQRLVRQLVGDYAYLEIGSETGGSLLPHLIDEACFSAVSIDLRPQSQPDERGVVFHYPDNTTARMRRILTESAGEGALQKLTTFDADASKVALATLPAPVDLAMIDGEHTDVACFSDFCSVLAFVKADAVIAFHDANLVSDAIQNAEKMLDHLEIPYATVFLPDCVAAIGIRAMAEPVRQLSSFALDRPSFLDASRKGRWLSVANAVADAGGLENSGRAVSELNEVKAKLAQAEAQCIQCSKHAADLEQAAAAAALRATALEQSTSWRVTAPLRALASFLRGQR